MKTLNYIIWKIKQWVAYALRELVLLCLRISYFRQYPLNENLGKTLFGKEFIISSKERRRINEIRLKNVVATLLSHTGSILALVITLYFGLYSVDLPAKALEKLLGSINTFLVSKEWVIFPYPPLSNDTLASLIVFVAVTLLFLFLSVIILRKIIEHLSPEEYTKTTIGSLNQEELLTFLAYKNWKLVDDFLETVVPKDEFDRNNFDWNKLEDCVRKQLKLDTQIKRADDMKSSATISSAAALKSDEPEGLYVTRIKQFLKDNFKEIQQSIFMIRGSYERLGINKRELTNHVLKFSPAIFYNNLNAVLENLMSLEYFNGPVRDDSITNHYMKDFCYLIYDLTTKRQRLLEEVIFFDNTHKYLIGMSSHISTSQSLKVFIRGISQISNNYAVKCERNEAGTEQIGERYLKELKAILHRSKSHCGVDLLISLENFEQKYISKDKIISKKLLELRTEGTSIKQQKEELPKTAETLKTIKKQYWEKINPAQKKLFEKFEEALDEIPSETVKSYFIVFGYSELVRKCLRSVADKLNSDEHNIKVFILLDNDLKAMDTRSFMFALKKKFPESEEKKTKAPVGNGTETSGKEETNAEPKRTIDGPVQKSFTGSDKLIQALVNMNDQVYFLAGAEVYDEKTGKLLHTNKYQTRVEAIINALKKKNQAPPPKIWILAEEYKIYSDYPNDMTVFGNQFYQDYYETLDLYDLRSLFEGEGNIKVISD